MKDKKLGWIGLGLFVASLVPFWLWKLTIVTGPAVPIFMRAFVLLFGLALAAGFVLGCRVILKVPVRWPMRGLFLFGLLGWTVQAALMAGMAMDFVGQ